MMAARFDEELGGEITAGMPPMDFPDEATLTERPAKPKREKPRLATIAGNADLAPAPTAAEALPQNFSEDHLAGHFVEVYGESWRHVRPWGAWLEWTGDKWTKDETSKVEDIALQVTRDALTWAEAKSLTAKERRQVNKKSTAWALRDVAATRRKCAASIDQWDKDPLLLGVPGGVVDLRDGTMLEPQREQYISKSCAVAPSIGKPELWLKYLDRAHDGNAEVIAYLQRYLGYCTTGETKEHALLFAYGTGRNGKGVLLETARGILGEYARTSSMDTFMEQKYSAHPTELARLQGARLVVTEEAAAGGRWNESRIKHITGGGKITAHYMRQDDFEFTPSFKLLIAANHKPTLRSVDEAIKSRIHLVPFKVTIPPEERDKDLLKKLELEWPQILGWILDGCSEWQRNGLQVPQLVLDATDQYLESEDVLGAWIGECCDRGGRMIGANAYANYKNWSERGGDHPVTRRAWTDDLTVRGFPSDRGGGGRRMIAGLTLKVPDYDPAGRYDQ